MNVGLVVVPIEPVDVVLLPIMDVDSVGVDQHRRGEGVDLADDDRPVTGAVVDDDDVVPRSRPQADALGRVGLGHPVPDALMLVQQAHLGQELQRILWPVATEALAALEGQFEGGALDVLDDDQEIVRVNPPALRRPLEEIVRVTDDELVERRGRRHEDRQRAGSPAVPSVPACCQVLAIVPG